MPQWNFLNTNPMKTETKQKNQKRTLVRIRIFVFELQLFAGCKKKIAKMKHNFFIHLYNETQLNYCIIKL